MRYGLSPEAERDPDDPLAQSLLVSGGLGEARWPAAVGMATTTGGGGGLERALVNA